MDEGILTITGRGNVVSADIRHAVDHLFEMQKHMNPEEFIAQLIRVWAMREPELARTYQSRTSHGTLLNEHAATKDLSFRKLLDVPIGLWELVSFFYPDEVKDLKWCRWFANTFPAFKVPEAKA
jgi:hypothetical protein